MKKLFTLIISACFISAISYSQRIETAIDLPGFNEHNFCVLEEKGLAFFAYEGKLWATNGTQDGTYMVKDIQPDPNASNAAPSSFVAMNGYVYFKAYTKAHGIELWRTDGSEDGTSMVLDIFPGGSTNGAQFSDEQIIVYKNELYFAAWSNIETGVELWKSDGTAEGTRLVKNIVSTPDYGSNPRCFVIHNNLLYFLAISSDYYASAYSLFVTDGSEEGTYLVYEEDITKGFNIDNIRVMLGKLFLSVKSEDYGTEIYVSDGTTEGTKLLKNIDSDKYGDYYNLYDMVELNGNVFFKGQCSDYKRQLWKTDGTTDGTQLVKLVNPIENHTDVSGFYVFDNKIFFSVSSSNGASIYFSDGTEEGTRVFENEMVADGYFIYMDRMYFYAREVSFTKWGQFLMSIGSGNDNPVVHYKDEHSYNNTADFLWNSHFFLNDNLFFVAKLTGDTNHKIYKLVNEQTHFFEANSDSRIIVYPNPFSDYLNIDNLEDVADINIYNIASKKVLHISNNINTNLSINTNNLEKGIYIISIAFHDKGPIIFKILKR